jgi:hypothetical protein
LVSVVLPHLRKVHYFSDGVSSQYKKCKTFLDLKYEDFHIAAEWNFFATSHGKICWDGIG